MSCTATVKWFDSKKGYGFATPETGESDIFIHSANIGKDDNGKVPYLEDGDKIFYNLGEHNGRPTAMDVTLPVGTVKKAPPRRRGRDAKKNLDDESETIEKEEESTATEQVKSEMQGENAPPKEGGGKGGAARHRAALGETTRA